MKFCKECVHMNFQMEKNSNNEVWCKVKRLWVNPNNIGCLEFSQVYSRDESVYKSCSGGCNKTYCKTIKK